MTGRPVPAARVGLLDYPGAEIRLRTASPAERKRLGACHKEPWTVAWIEREVRAGDVMWDVGANVGAYSLLAARARGAVVYAFEPSFATYAALCENVVLNGLEGSVHPLPIALGATSGVSSLGLRSLEAGAAIHTMAGAPQLYLEFDPVWQQPLVVQRGDDLAALLGVPVPEHVKIDVDGPELEVLRGAQAVLGDSRLRTLLIEVEPELERPVAEILAGHGLELRERHRKDAGGRFAPPVYAIYGR